MPINSIRLRNIFIITQGRYDLNVSPPRPPGLPSSARRSELAGYTPLSSPDRVIEQVALDQLDITGHNRPLSVSSIGFDTYPASSSSHWSSTCDTSPESSPLLRFGADGFYCTSFQSSPATTIDMPLPGSPPPVRRHSTDSPEIAAPDGFFSVVGSLLDHPLCRSIVKNCREQFKTSNAILAVADHDRLVYLATSNVKDGEVLSESVLPFHATICAHTALNQTRGLVVHDTASDWRFKDSLPATQLGVPFYAAIPLTVPRLLVDPSSRRVVIGSLCLVHHEPRPHFAHQDLEILRGYADSASREIEDWVRKRLLSLQLDRYFDHFRHQLDPLTTSSMDTTETVIYDFVVHTIKSSLRFELAVLAAQPPGFAPCKLVSRQTHIDALRGDENGLQYDGEDDDHSDPPTSSEGSPKRIQVARGLLLPVVVKSEETGIILGAFSWDQRMRLMTEDVIFVKRVVRAAVTCLEGKKDPAVAPA
ncbi:BZ3500_MvSof-1268-A1-R1_Chr3-1g05458 [Microbotryum saponariae]|uniref:BZ3500_MvSof-1268-A1-R1_Chr3-1g05458 protein n=1 Tax=Microbotryum saponariae TaxID=289078 RepID=A0A2X0MVR8_9BASI|nr:BZ3500_MvSof-1268-A1-R1_Chr3-1g05458 [Microbotryum saponariae]SDA04649.1 BZ3501_MvSof-1269-A2-R1_Chr3-1g05129 [Microbotryum saponariae]